jgi:molybdopterin-containing oxidoreductase family membrane subunit
MNKKYRSSISPSFIYGNRTKEDVENDIVNVIGGKPTKRWLGAMAFSLLLLTFGGYCVYRTWWDGVGMWGENKTIGWAWDITNFVWWIGLGHAGTLISAILLLFRAKWRNSINRSAEAMTLCAVTCSGFFILAHLGRPWLTHFIFPYPNTYGSIWPNFNSPLVWDAFAVLTYFLVSLLFWYLGLVPDLATMKERTTGVRRWLYKVFSLNWDSSAWTWRRYKSVMLVIAGLATALVVSVHSIVSMDFSSGIVPGWHSTIFPPYFVAGAILSGFAMVISLMIIARYVLDLENYITIEHVDRMNQIVILNSGLIGIAYFTEIFMAYYSMNGYESGMMNFRIFGYYKVYFIIMMSCNVFIPQLLLIKKIRRNIIASFIISIFVNVGMWVERFVLIVTSLAHDFLPSSWAIFDPTMYDIGTFIFSFGLFMSMFLLFARYLPIISMSEVKEDAMSYPSTLSEPEPSSLQPAESRGFFRRQTKWKRKRGEELSGNDE